MKPPERAAYMWSIIKDKPNAMVPWYLLTSWLYYERDISLLPDDDYDKLCKKLLTEWSSIEHPHKQFVDYEGLSAGTGFAISHYPEITQHGASRLAIEDNLVHWNKKRKQWEAIT